ncbi:hypothetical protein JXB31_02150 [Candidatus Woesearchaeota archaeon]|nr:hypothetical protein [Candidatus Woesearchaeota archaeon]
MTMTKNSTLEDLKFFEEQQKKRLEAFIKNSETEILDFKKKAEKELAEKKAELIEKKENRIRAEEENTRKNLKKDLQVYHERMLSLESMFEKNKTKAVDAVLKEIIIKNV